MSITKQDALDIAASGEWFHYGTCTKVVGPRGGVKVSTVQVRPSGQCKTWVTRPDEFRLPIKHGLYQHGEVTQHNCGMFHRVKDCPAK